MVSIITNNLTIDQLKKTYAVPFSVLKHLPWVEFDNENQCIISHDQTIGAVFELSLVASEAKPDSYLQQLRDGLQGIFQDTFPQYRDEEMPWILQFYVQDELSMAYLYNSVSNYIHPHAKNSQFSESYLKLIKGYTEWLAKAGGVFIDDKVTGSPFFGGQRKVRVVMYRQYSPKMTLRRGRSAVDDLNQVATSFVSKLKGVGIKSKRLDGQAFRSWLIRWFNPKPKSAEGSTDKLLDLITYPGNKEEIPYGYDFAEQLFYSVPESNENDGVWYFEMNPLSRPVFQ